MQIDNKMFQSLLKQAESNPRLRQNFDLRTSESDTSQRMLNAVLPGTSVPIHRHCNTTEVVILLKGRLDEVIYDERGVEVERYCLDASSDNSRLCVVEAGVWHTIEVIEPSVLFEAKDGAFRPLSSDDIKK